MLIYVYASAMDLFHTETKFIRHTFQESEFLQKLSILNLNPCNNVGGIEKTS